MAGTIDLSDEPARAWPWRPVVIWAAASLTFAAVLAGQVGLPFDVALRQSATYFGVLALLMVPVARQSWQWSSHHRGLPLALRHVALAGLVVVLWRGTMLVHDRLAVGPDFWTIVYAGTWLFQFQFDIVAYSAALGVVLSAQASRRERDRERREAELRLVARDAELGAIRAQFQPHFVLNTLNSVVSLIDADPALARTMVVRLADLMRAVFDRVDLPTVPLERELDLVRAYLDIERIRFGPRLSVHLDIDDAARGVPVPPFLLQPIVENAVTHGIAPSTRPGEVRLVARLAGSRLHIAVENTAVASGGIGGTGRGLQLTRRRLDSVYGSSYELTFDRRADGASVRIDVPAGEADVA